MNKKQIITTCCVVLLSVSGASAQQQLRISQAECREMALAHSEDLQRSENALRQAELDRKIAKTAFLPNVDASATGAYVLPDMDMMGRIAYARHLYGRHQPDATHLHGRQNHDRPPFGPVSAKRLPPSSFA